MSAVLMCDMPGCNQLFSVNKRGWTQVQQSIPVSENNPYNHGQKTLHMCPQCAPTDNDDAGTPKLARSVTVALEKAGPQDAVKECKYCDAPVYTDSLLCASSYYTGKCEE